MIEGPHSLPMISSGMRMNLYATGLEGNFSQFI